MKTEPFDSATWAGGPVRTPPTETLIFATTLARCRQGRLRPRRSRVTLSGTVLRGRTGPVVLSCWVRCPTGEWTQVTRRFEREEVPRRGRAEILVRDGRVVMRLVSA